MQERLRWRRFCPVCALVLVAGLLPVSVIAGSRVIAGVPASPPARVAAAPSGYVPNVAAAPSGYVPNVAAAPSGYVPNAAAACRIGRAYVAKSWGQASVAAMTWTAFLAGDVWHVWGNPPRRSQSDALFLMISQRTGAVRGGIGMASITYDRVPPHRHGHHHRKRHRQTV